MLPVINENFNLSLATKSNVAAFVSQLELKIEDGELSAIELKSLTSFLAEIVKKIGSSKVIREEGLVEFAGYGEREIVVHGHKITQRETGTRYDFTGSEAWNDLQSQIAVLKEQQKEVEQIAKATKRQSVWVSPDGEELTVMPAGKSSTTNLVITLAKE